MVSRDFFYGPNSLLEWHVDQRFSSQDHLHWLIIVYLDVLEGVQAVDFKHGSWGKSCNPNLLWLRGYHHMMWHVYLDELIFACSHKWFQSHTWEFLWNCFSDPKSFLYWIVYHRKPLQGHDGILMSAQLNGLERISTVDIIQMHNIWSNTILRTCN